MSNIFWIRFYDMCALKGLKPNPVAKEIGISSGSVTKWKIEGSFPNGETLIKIADYLDCSVDYLLGRTDVPEVNYGTVEESNYRIAAYGAKATRTDDQPPIDENIL